MKAKEFIREFRDIDPADDPNSGMDREFKQDSIFNQLGKILDSQGNPNPLDTVTTDDGKKFKVTFKQATLLRRLLTAPTIKPQVKSQFTKDLQQSQTLEKYLQADDMVELFISTYNPEKTEPSPYTKYEN